MTGKKKQKTMTDERKELYIRKIKEQIFVEDVTSSFQSSFQDVDRPKENVLHLKEQRNNQG